MTLCTEGTGNHSGCVLQWFWWRGSFRARKRDATSSLLTRGQSYPRVNLKLVLNAHCPVFCSIAWNSLSVINFKCNFNQVLLLVTAFIYPLYCSFLPLSLPSLSIFFCFMTRHMYLVHLSLQRSPDDTALLRVNLSLPPSRVLGDPCAVEVSNPISSGQCMGSLSLNCREWDS